MAAAPKARLQALSEQLAKPRESPGTFEDIPRIPTIAGDSMGPRVKDKVVIVTGANSPLGIGRASAHLFARNGAKAIFICDFNTNHLETHKREINSLYPGVEIIPTKMDAGVEEDVERVVNDALAKFGRLDIFFANAGISVTMTNVLESNADDFMRVMRTNALRRVKDKVVIVTGANSPLGIGRASAHLFARNGAKAIFICDFNTNHLETHKREINSLYPGVEIIPTKMDAGVEEDVERVVNDALAKFGRLDIFFANAGISVTMTNVLESNADDFMRVMRTNALSVFLAVKHGARGMLQTSSAKPYPAGSIIGTASSAGLRSNAGATDYSASKAAVISIMQTTCYQLAGTGIRCNAICPGLIETGMTSPVFEYARSRGTEKRIGQLNPLKRGGLADEVARVALFLGSDESSYVNGQAWAVCGGLTSGHPYVPGKLA